jgi:peptide deformylase
MQVKDFSLRTEGDPLLTQKLKPYEFNKDTDPAEIEQTMIQLMDKHYGYGIAANQVGFDQRVIVIQPKEQQAFALFNPEVIESDGEYEAEEGCLSFPGVMLDLRRPKTVEVKYFDHLARSHTRTFNEIDAKCVLHEIDHLNGITFKDHVSQLKYDMAVKRGKK